jgi:hypothetical protein
MTILRHVFFIKSYRKKYAVSKEKREFTCYCKIVSSGKFLQVRLIIIIFNEKVFTSGILPHKSTKSRV